MSNTNVKFDPTPNRLTTGAEKDRPDAREFGDWTRKGPLPDVGGQRRVSDRAGFSSGGRNSDNASEAGGERNSRRPAYEGDGKVRDFGNWDRKGPLTPTVPNGPSARSNDRPVSHDGPRDRRNSPAWGEGRSQEGSRPPRREFVERPIVDRAPTAPELDNQWRTKMRPDPPAPVVAPVVAPTKSPALSSREVSTPPSPAAPAPVPNVRPKLNLAKRTISEAEPNSKSPLVTDSKASPFGAAKPIDTAAREKEVEEKRQVALREKKEAEEKAREEKKAAEDKAREERKVAREAEKTEKASSSRDKPNGQESVKENGAAAPQPGRNYEILRRKTIEDANSADQDPTALGENGKIIEDKAVGPKEIVRDISPKNVDGELANGDSSPQVGASTDTTADTLEDDGWSTVSKPRNNRRNGNQASRAIAS